MKTVWKVLQILLGIFMIFGGVQHFLNPEFYEPFVPGFLPFKSVVIFLSGVITVFLGALLFIPKFTKFGAIGIFALMLVYLPIHIWDVFSETPAIGSHEAALVRLPVQFIFILWARKIKESVNNTNI